MKSESRLLAEQIKSITNQSLVIINFQASHYVSSGLVKTQTEALSYMLELLK